MGGGREKVHKFFGKKQRRKVEKRDTDCGKLFAATAPEQK